MAQALEPEPDDEFRRSAVVTLSRPARRWWRLRHPRASHT
jgi:hypothetical protein